MKKFRKVKKYIVSLLTAAFFVCVGAFFATLGSGTAVTANAASHSCYLLGNPNSIGQTEVDYLMANLDTPENVGLTPSAEPYKFFLTEDISWEGEFVAPDGVFVVICLNGYTATGTVNNDASTGGLYFIQCDIHNCAEYGGAMPTVSQAFFDFMLKANMTDINLTVALSEDVVISDTFVLSEYSNLYICKNGYTVTGGKNANVNGGNLSFLDCSLMHYCYYSGGNSMGINQDMIDLMISLPATSEAWGMEPSDEPYYAYLCEDVSWEGEFVVPDGVKIALCLNGHTMDGVINNEATTGAIYAMQCGIHSCPVLGETFMAISAGYIEMMEDTMLAHEETVDLGSGGMIALLDDITLRYPEVWAAPASNSIVFCTCGHTITNIEYMRANGATINLVNCSDMAPHACEGLGYEEAEYFTQTSLGYMVDESGVLLGDREQNLCLLGNVKLEKTLVIPVGMSVNLCLNGFTLTSPNIVWGHEGKPDECCTAIQVMPGASLTICDCSATQSGRVTVNYNPTPMGWGALGASAVLNYGSFTLKSGTLVGTMALLNAGDTVIKDGSIVGLLVGVAQGVQVTEDIGTDRTPTFVMENGEVHSMGLGVVGVEGEIVMNKGEITAQIAGIGTGIDVENPEGNAILYLNSGVINVGRIEAKAYIAAGLPVNENGESELKVSSDMCVGVVVSTTLVLGGDVVINIEGPLAEVASTTAEILMADGAILKSNKDSVIENVYEVTVNEDDAVGLIDSSVMDNIVPADSNRATFDENGEMIIEKSDGSFVETASVYGYSLSLKGDIQANFYITAEEEFVNNPDARVIFMYRGVKTVYKLSDAKRQSKYYIFSINVSAKDYQKNIHCSFTDGVNLWFGASSTVNKYLNRLINPDVETYATRGVSQKEIALCMQNYCMAASYHFGVAEDYVPTEEMAEVMASVTAADLAEFAGVKSGESSRLTFAGTSLFLQSATTIRFYFYLNSGVDISDVTITVDGVAVNAVKSGSAYYIEISNIRAQDLGKAFTVNLDGIVINYSALSYAYSILNQATAAQDLLDVAKSLYIYYEAAYAYFN